VLKDISGGMSFTFLPPTKARLSIWRVGKVITEILDYRKGLHIKNPAGSRRIDFDTRASFKWLFRGDGQRDG
jgi:hypothetical protein